MYIEEPVRDLVKFLRDNGINTECSCGHEPRYIQCQLILDGTIQLIHNLLHLYFSNRNLPITYEIEIHLDCVNGRWYSSMEIRFPKQEEDNGN